MSKALYEKIEIRICKVCKTKFEYPTRGHGEHCSHTCWEVSVMIEAKRAAAERQTTA